MKLFMLHGSRFSKVSFRRRLLLLVVLLAVAVGLLLFTIYSHSNKTRAGVDRNNTKAATSPVVSRLAKKATISIEASQQNLSVGYPTSWHTDSGDDSEVHLVSPSGLEVVIQSATQSSDGEEDIDYKTFGKPIRLFGANYHLAAASYWDEEDESKFIGVFLVNDTGTSRQISIGSSRVDGSPVVAQISIIESSASGGTSQANTLKTVQDDKEFATAVAIIKSMQTQ